MATKIKLNQLTGEPSLFIQDNTRTGRIEITMLTSELDTKQMNYEEVIVNEVQKPKDFEVQDFDESVITTVDSIEEGVVEFLKIHPQFDKDGARTFVFGNRELVQ